MMRERSQAQVGEWTQVYAYLTDLCHQLTRPTDRAAGLTRAARDEAPGTLFRLLTQRAFTYLTRKRCEPYRRAVEAYIRRAIAEGGPVRLYYDIGGGYRASLQPNQLPPSFTPGLGELLALCQVRSFIEHAQPHCPVPIRFTLVIDNLCAHFVNGVALTATERYCAALRTVLAHFDLSRIDLLVESEHVGMADYENRFEAALTRAQPPDALTPSAHENVERFNARRMPSHEAREYVARYAAGSSTTEAGWTRLIGGIRLTQRATPDSLAFRPFPGGDQRIQCGDVALAIRNDGRVNPTLLSSANYERYRSEQVDIAEWSIPHVEAIRVLY